VLHGPYQLDPNTFVLLWLVKIASRHFAKLADCLTFATRWLLIADFPNKASFLIDKFVACEGGKAT